MSDQIAIPQWNTNLLSGREKLRQISLEFVVSDDLLVFCFVEDTTIAAFVALACRRNDLSEIVIENNLPFWVSQIPVTVDDGLVL